MSTRWPAAVSDRPRKRLLAPGALALVGAIVAGLCAARWASQALARRRLYRDLTAASYRPIDGRVSDRRLDGHRPLRPPSRGAGDAPEPSVLPLAELSVLQRAGDEHGLAVALLLAGEPGQARLRLERLGDAPAVSNDQAVAALAAGDATAALPLLDRVLDREPLHPQALFNRAVALRALDLPLTASRLFERVAALGEPGWSTEASAEAQRLRSLYRQRADAAARSGEVRRALILQGRLPAAGEGLADDLRQGLYEAVWSAPTRAAVEHLLPLAERLDRHYGGSTLVGYLRRVAASDFAVRGPVAQQFAALERAPQDRALIESLLRQPDQPAVADILLGTLVRARPGPSQLARFDRLAATLRDPWFDALVSELHSDDVYRLRQDDQALRAAEDGLERCRVLGTSVRCMQLRLRVVRGLSDLYRVTEALGHLRQALGEARQAGWVDEEAQLLELAGETESVRVGGALGRAYFEELLLHPRASCASRSGSAETLARMALGEGRAWNAAGYLNQVPDCGGGAPVLTTNGVIRAAALRRIGGTGLDELRVVDSLAAIERSPYQEGRYLYFLARGLWLMPEQPAVARGLLQAALGGVSRLAADDLDRRYVESKTHLALAMEAARVGQWQLALDQLAAAPGVAIPDGCLLGMAVDVERSFSVVRDSEGRVEGWYRVDDLELLAGGPDRPALLPAAARARLARCAEVRVITPGNQRSWIDVGTPAGLPWSYAVRPSGAAAPPPLAVARRLVVADPTPPAAVRLPALAPTALDESPGTRVLRGGDANPAQVLAELPAADLVEFRVHGVSDANVSEYTALVLSPDTRGNYLLTQKELRAVALPHRPVVILAACRGARRTTLRPDSSELAGAFIRAGARAVFAAMTSIPDADADTFFAAVRTALAAGRSPAVALRDARSSWAGRRNSWIQGVLVFE